jgi:hypothetical protein
MKTRFGKLSIFGSPFSKRIKGKSVMFTMVVCDCGIAKEVRIGNLTSGSTNSCGCLGSKKKRERLRTHGQSATLLYSRWCSMHERCKGYKAQDRKRYTERGITVCPEWSSFEKFKEDMDEPPSPAHTLDRIDNDAGYSKENCRWATKEEQSNNKTRSVFIEHEGTRKTVAQWARDKGVCPKALMYRIKAGWDAGQALSVEYKHSNKMAR